MPQMGASLRELQESLEKSQRKALVPNEVAEVREKLREQHHEMINALPADSLGDGGMDPTDRGTWYKSDDPELREWAAEFLGVTGVETKRGLSNSEKEMLFAASEADIERSTSPEAIRQFKKDDRAFNDALAGLYPSYALQYPEGAADPQGAREAMSRLLQNSPLSKGQLAAIATGSQEERNKILDMVWEEQTSPGSVTNRGRSGMPSRQHDDDFRTGGFSTGSSGVSGGGGQREVQAESFNDAIGSWKRRNGFHR